MSDIDHPRHMCSASLLSSKHIPPKYDDDSIDDEVSPIVAESDVLRKRATPTIEQRLQESITQKAQVRPSSLVLGLINKQR